MSKEAMKRAKAWFERNTYGDEAVDVYEALCEALAEQPAQQEPCDMGSLCIGCSPRSIDGSCPGKNLNNACDCYSQGFSDGMKELEQPAQQEPVACKHEWFRTGAMEAGQCRCINCGTWNTITAGH